MFFIDLLLKDEKPVRLGGSVLDVSIQVTSRVSVIHFLVQFIYTISCIALL